MALMAGILLKERVSKRQWLGLIIGLLGLYLVLFERLDLTSELAFDGFPNLGRICCHSIAVWNFCRSGLSEALFAVTWT
jgi:drug/metabolite transporter (DMT)-like permease